MFTKVMVLFYDYTCIAINNDMIITKHRHTNTTHNLTLTFPQASDYLCLEFYSSCFMNIMFYLFLYIFCAVCVLVQNIKFFSSLMILDSSFHLCIKKFSSAKICCYSSFLLSKFSTYSIFVWTKAVDQKTILKRKKITRFKI